MPSVDSVNASTFQTEVIEGSKPVLVDFFAPWCSHCVRLSPVLDELANDISEKVKIVKVNVDESRALAQKYGVMSLPTMILFKSGEPSEKWMGYMPKDTIKDKLSEAL